MLEKFRAFSKKEIDKDNNAILAEAKGTFKKISVPKKEKNIDIELLADIKQIPYSSAKAIMDNMTKKCNISYSEYMDNKLFIYKTDAGLNGKIEKMRKKEEELIETIAADTGWSTEKTIQRANELYKKFGLSYRKIAGYRFYSMPDELVRQKLDSWNETAKKNREIVKAATGWSMHKIRLHMRRYAVLYDIISAYYILYKAWELTDEEMDSYARQKNSEKLWLKYNDREEAKVLAEKDKFDQVYADYIKRKYWLNVDTNYDEFLQFVDGLEYIFCKPIKFGGGLNTEKYKVERGKEKELYDLLMSKDRLLVEECVVQHKDVDEFLPGCVNTVRMVVLYQDGKCNFICAGMRFGYHGITDNFSQDGMVVDVDVETGIVQTNAIDKKGNIYEKHPISGKTFVGFQIPHWEMAKKVAEDAIKVQDGVNYVGWDLAICENKVSIIEGNCMPDLVLVQAPYAPQKEGKKYLFEKFF